MIEGQKVLLLCALLGGWLGSSSCLISRCSSDLDCVKSCPCSNGGNCTVGLSCVNTICEAEEFPICQVPEDFCEKYKAKGLCGSKKCDVSEDCRKVCDCPPRRFEPMPGTAVTCTYQCKKNYSCLESEGMCDQSYASQTCDDVCGAAIALDTQCNVAAESGCKRSSPSVLPTPGG